MTKTGRPDMVWLDYNKWNLSTILILISIAKLHNWTVLSFDEVMIHLLTEPEGLVPLDRILAIIDEQEREQRQYPEYLEFGDIFVRDQNGAVFALEGEVKDFSTSFCISVINEFDTLLSKTHKILDFNNPTKYVKKPYKYGYYILISKELNWAILFSPTDIENDSQYVKKWIKARGCDDYFLRMKGERYGTVFSLINSEWKLTKPYNTKLANESTLIQNTSFTNPSIAIVKDIV